MREFLAKNKTVIMPQPPYSPELEFMKLFHGRFIYPKVFARNLLKGNRQRNIFLIFRFDAWPGIRNRTLHLIGQHTRFYWYIYIYIYIYILIIKLKIHKYLIQPCISFNKKKIIIFTMPNFFHRIFYSFPCFVAISI